MSYPYATIRKGPYSVYSPPTLYGPSGYGAYGAASSQPCIRKGAKGEAVRALQRSLAGQGYDAKGNRTREIFESDGAGTTSRGYATSDLRPDGDFGGGTEKALKAFQRDNGLTPDGIAGPETWNKLGSSGLPCGGSGGSGSGGGRGSGGSSSSPKTYVSPSGEVLPTGFKAPFYEEKWFYWTAGLGGAAILAALVFWPKGKK